MPVNALRTASRRCYPLREAEYLRDGRRGGLREQTTGVGPEMSDNFLDR